MTRRRSERAEAFRAPLSGFSPELAPIAEEIHRLWWYSVMSAKIQFASRALWNFIHILTTTLASIIAAVTGAAALGGWADESWIGAMALVAAALAGLAAVVSAKERAAQAADAANAYIDLRDAFRQLLQLDLAVVPYAQARATLDELTRRYHEVNRAAQPPLQLARYWATRPLYRDSGGGIRSFSLNPTTRQQVGQISDAQT